MAKGSRLHLDLSEESLHLLKVCLTTYVTECEDEPFNVETPIEEFRAKQGRYIHAKNLLAKIDRNENITYHH